MIQSQVWDRKKILNKNILIELLMQKIHETDFNKAKNDISPFIKKSSSIEIWSKDFFKDVLKRIQTIN